MKNIIVLCLIAIAILLTSCVKDNSGTVVEENLDITFTDNLGDDLLDPSNKNGFSSNDIRLFTLANNVKKEVYYANWNYSHAFMLYRNDSLNRYFLRVFLLQEKTLLQLSPTETDTITCTIDNSNGNSLIRKAWYNGDLKWEFGKLAPSITIVK